MAGVDGTSYVGASEHPASNSNAPSRTEPVKALLVEKIRFMMFYMNASRLCKFSCVLTDRMGCSSISGLLAADTAAAGPYEIR
jgi:hypothetical protein